ncbi:hypothetical protein QNI19_01680 [Cytophagaceae bacterium DM2B3-1]|uniref:Uncharacterized protein n=2 Tax=Xanthocytophaga flava TaxID=3048013 RepID=A0ABT7CD78_9BACT|nr:hypothetical protein [Xanthocytophaga flavus]MDJ1470537.1 hypothetical protein [Xanthocytophaga flavus]MDJ1491620.1 hypothetical protein [Xanthocytophaga flavus]
MVKPLTVEELIQLSLQLLTAPGDSPLFTQWTLAITKASSKTLIELMARLPMSNVELSNQEFEKLRTLYPAILAAIESSNTDDAVWAIEKIQGQFEQLNKRINVLIVVSGLVVFLMILLLILK